MCEMLGTEPVESEIPVERGDLASEIQEALHFYDFLPSMWESAVYIGKDYSLLSYLFTLHDTPKIEQKFILDIVKIVDNLVSTEISKKQKQMQERYEREHGKKTS